MERLVPHQSVLHEIVVKSRVLNLNLGFKTTEQLRVYNS